MNGIIAGIVAGIILGFMMVRMRMFAQIGSLIGMPNALSGFLFHLVINAILGIIFAVIFVKAAKSFFNCAIWGVIFGLVWWFVGSLTIAPLMMGMPVVWNNDAMMNALPMLMGELTFGLVLGICYYGLRRHQHS